MGQHPVMWREAKWVESYSKWREVRLCRVIFKVGMKLIGLSHNREL